MLLCAPNVCLRSRELCLGNSEVMWKPTISMLSLQFDWLSLVRYLLKQLGTKGIPTEPSAIEPVGQEGVLRPAFDESCRRMLHLPTLHKVWRELLKRLIRL